MSEWKTVKLGDVATLITSGSRGWAAYYADEGAKFVRMTNLPRYGINMKLDDMKYVKLPANNSEGSRTRLQEGDVLISITAELGKIGYVPADLGEAYINQHVALVRLDKNKVVPKMLAYKLSTTKVRNELNRRNDSGAKAGLNLPTIQKLPISIPDINTQHRIVSILEIWNKYLELLEKKIALKKNLEKGLMLRLLRGDAHLRGHTNAWIDIKLGELGDTYTGLSGKSKDDFGSGKPFITYVNIYSNPVVDSGQYGLVSIDDNEHQNSVKYGDILFTTSSETPHEVGIASIYLGDEDELYLNSFSFGFRLKDFSKLSPAFASHYLRGNDFRRLMTRLAQGASRYNLSKKHFLETTIHIPSDINEQVRIAAILDNLRKDIKLLHTQKTLVESQRKFLINNLGDGDVLFHKETGTPMKGTIYA